MKDISKGKFKIIESDSGFYQVMNCETRTYHYSSLNKDEAQFIKEAFEVYTETGKTPRELNHRCMEFNNLLGHAENEPQTLQAKYDEVVENLEFLTEQLEEERNNSNSFMIAEKEDGDMTKANFHEGGTHAYNQCISAVKLIKDHFQSLTKPKEGKT